MTARRAPVDARRPGAHLLLLLALPLAALVVLGAGCGSGSGDDQGGSGGSGSAASLAGTSWHLTGWSVSSLDPADFTITAEFKDGRVAGKSAVNQYGGPYSAGDDGSFSVGDIVTTMMAGPEPDMRAESAYLELLAKAKTFMISGDALTLLDAGGNESLLFAAGE